MQIKSLTLHSANLSDQHDFYVQKLGFSVLSKTEDELIIKAGNTELRFVKSDTQPFYHYCFLVPANQLDEAMKWAQEKMQLIETEDGFKVETDALWQAHSCYFLDGNGNIAEFISHYNLDNHSDASFSAQNIISINEIGCPNKNISQLNSWIEKNVGSKFWTGNTTRIGTNGDENGCFLLVNNEDKKTWYPTDRFPEIAPFEITAEQNNQSVNLKYSKTGFEKI